MMMRRTTTALQATPLAGNLAVNRGCALPRRAGLDTEHAGAYASDGYKHAPSLFVSIFNTYRDHSPLGLSPPV